MGRKQSLVCPICNYEVLTSGGPDRGFTISTNTFCCVDCKTMVDLVLEEPKEFRLSDPSKYDWIPNKIKDGQKCRKCNGNNFELWDNKKKSCPKCGTRMNPGGTTMNWD